MVKIFDKNKKVLDLGSGIEKITGALRVDNKEVEPDVIHDLNVFPYPFEDEQFEEVHLNNILLHLDDVFL